MFSTILREAYLFQMLVHPFGKCFLLDRVSFVCNHKDDQFVRDVHCKGEKRTLSFYAFSASFSLMYAIVPISYVEV